MLDSSIGGVDIHRENNEMGRHLFDRDDPDGWSELSLDWVDTGTMLAGISFARRLTDSAGGDAGWDAASFLGQQNLEAPEDVVNYIDELFFQETLPADTKRLLNDYLVSDSEGNPLPWDMEAPDFDRRIRSFTRHFGDERSLLDVIIPGYSEAESQAPNAFSLLNFLQA